MRSCRSQLDIIRRNRRRLVAEHLEDRIALSISPLLVTGAGPGGGPHVKAFEGTGTDEVASYFAYSPAFGGGVRVAVGDVNGDGHLDTITGAGPGGGPHVRVFSGLNQSELLSFFAYDRAFTGGVFVAAGDVNADGRADIITGQGQGGLPHVRVFNGVNGQLLQEWFAYDINFRGGVTVAAGYFNNDARADIVTGAGPGGGPHVRVFDGQNVVELASFFAYSPDFTGGVYVATGNFDADSRADVATTPFSNGGPHLRIRAGSDFHELTSVFLKSPQRGGSQHSLPVAAADFDRDGLDEIVIGSGAGELPLVSIYKPGTSPPVAEFLAYDQSFRGGVYVAADNVTPPGDLPPVVTAMLAEDNGLSNTDGITTLPTISGTVSDFGPVTSLVASIDGTPLQEVAPGTADYRGSFVITQAMLETWLGGPIADGQHFVALQATDANGDTSPFVFVNFTLDRTPPTLVAPLADLAFFEDSPNQVLDIGPLFSGNGLTFSVTNTNPGVVQASVEGNNLILDFLENRFGEGVQAAQITVRATKPNGFFVEDTFVVDVVPQNDNPTVVSPLRNITVGRSASASQRLIALGGAFADADDLGTLVQFQMSLGNINVELFDTGTPISVQNFLRYANDTTIQGGDYNDSIIHRSARSPQRLGDPFVIQGGGFKDITTNSAIATDGTITNEPGFSNHPGTLAMARSSGVNSATSQWYFNISDNDFLDRINQGFTVFGRIVGNGMTVVNAIADLPRAIDDPNFDPPIGSYNPADDPFPGQNISTTDDLPNLLPPVFNEVPLRDYTFTNPPVAPTANQLVRVHRVVVDPTISGGRGGDTGLTYTFTNSDPDLLQLSLNGAHQLTYTINQSRTGTANITVRATDSTGAFVEQSFTITVTASPLMLAGDGSSSATLPTEHEIASFNPRPFTPEMEQLVHIAVAHWADAGLDSALVSRLRQVQFQLADLPGSLLGLAASESIWLDTDAAGEGWLLDSTSPDEIGRIDFLTVVAHELGHLLGLPDLDSIDSLMSESLVVGVRRLPSAELVDAMFSHQQ